MKIKRTRLWDSSGVKVRFRLRRRMLSAMARPTRACGRRILAHFPPGLSSPSLRNQTHPDRAAAPEHTPALRFGLPSLPSERPGGDALGSVTGTVGRLQGAYRQWDRTVSSTAEPSGGGAGAPPLLPGPALPCSEGGHLKYRVRQQGTGWLC